MVDPIKWFDEAPKWEKIWKELFLPVRWARAWVRRSRLHCWL